ncbi:dTDP-4-dehydrorhamnose reductase [Guptibacillus hwajinpoensis]|uniref:dTDP-4-dehydrorhamnose reductase n=1 Tax=Guptibacillus hwajinpoensis TaxID=208199 RepID=A0ABU0JZC5_9BACL|nr:dTDP-4-dehydrorhamnose reductase [Alkalihalobacillus hemicentroti]MDQ0482443.1 dTDP-4-dehydrorhamnose reductase [Alkalihalobacillus hemicentroti]
MSEVVLVTGSNGQLGYDVVKLLEENNYIVVGCNREKLDITNLDNVKQIFEEVNPSIIVHCAAYTNVDQAESDVELAYKVNAIGTRNLVASAEAIGAKFVYISTDYVFDGEGSEPYNEFMPTSPLGVYGHSKLAGEELVTSLSTKYFIVRTSWVYGSNGNNFVKTMLKLSEDRNSLNVVNDQRGCPTYTFDLAECILNLINTEKYGIYHASNSGSCTWFEFANAIFNEANINIQVNPVSTLEFPRPAKRPSYSVLDHMSLRLNEIPEMRPWQEALRNFLKVNKSLEKKV